MAPFVKCKWYLPSDGSPIRGGCKHPSCKFIHPSDQDFERAEDAKQLTRCKHFDNDGRPIPPGCFHKPGTCSYVHPDNPEWNFSKGEPSRFSRSARASASLPAVGAKPSTAGQAPPAEVVPQPPRPSSSLAEISRAPFIDKSRSHQTTINIPGQSASTETGKKGSVTTPFGSSNVVDKNQSVHSTAQVTKAIGATASTPAVSQNAENDTSRMWKRSINCLSRAIDMSNQLLEMENSFIVRKNLLFLTVGPNHISGAEKELETHEALAREKRKALELELGKVDRQLAGLGFWSVPINLSPSESSDRPLDLNRLLERLSILETRLSSSIDSRQGMDGALASLEDGATLDDVEEPGTQDVSERLNYLQTRVNQLETEVPHDRMLERLNDVVEDKMLDRLGPSDDTIQTITPNQEMPNAILKRIDEDLTQLCTDLIENVPVDVLDSNLQRLYSETESVRGNISHLSDEQRSLDARQDNVDVQMERLLQELNEMKTVAQTQEDARVAVLDDIMSNVQSRVDDEMHAVQEYVKQFLGSLESKILVDLEPTIAKTSIICKNIQS